MTEQKEEYGHEVSVKGNRCYRCEHKWIQREEEKPVVCPKCKSPYWDRPKTKFLKKNEK